jgi:hypothetical protein
MAFCDNCKCSDCQNGTEYISHAQTADGSWICDVCYTYDLCTASDAVKVDCDVPCEDRNCIHRPKIVSEWTKSK